MRSFAQQQLEWDGADMPACLSATGVHVAGRSELQTGPFHLLHTRMSVSSLCNGDMRRRTEVPFPNTHAISRLHSC